MEFLQSIISKGRDGPLQVMYRIDGTPFIPEETLDHLEGYKKSAPVRNGNNATNQLQLDVSEDYYAGESRFHGKNMDDIDILVAFLSLPIMKEKQQEYQYHLLYYVLYYFRSRYMDN